MVVLPILWTVVLAFQDLRLIDLRRRGLFGAFTLDNFAAVFSSPGFWAALRTTLLFSVVGTVSSIGIGLAAALALRGAFRGRTFVRASMLLPYVAPVVAVTFVWQTMLSPQFGIVNAIGTEVLGWDDPIAFLSQRSADVTVLGIEITVPVALLTVMAFEAWRYFPFAFLFLTARIAGDAPRPGEGGADGRGHGQPAVPLRGVPAAPADHRAAGRAAVHLHVQRVRRRLPAHRRGQPAPRWSACGCTTCSPLAATSARRRRRPWCSRSILVVLVGLYFRFVGRPTGDQT